MTTAQYLCKRCQTRVEWDSHLHRHDMFAENMCGWCTDHTTYLRRAIRRWTVSILLLPYTTLSIALSWLGDNLYEGVILVVEFLGGPAPHKATGKDPLEKEEATEDSA